MHIAAALQHVENLAGLCDGAKQRVITARAFLGFVETDRRALGMASGRKHAAIEVQRQRGRLEDFQPIQHQILRARLHLGDRALVEPGQQSAERRHAGHLPKTQRAQNHRIILIILHVAQSVKAQQQMQEDRPQTKTVGIQAGAFQMTAAILQFAPEPQPDKKLLEDHETPERSHLTVVIKFHAWNCPRCGVNALTGNFHFWWPFVLGGLVWFNSISTQAEGHFQPFLL